MDHEKLTIKTQQALVAAQKLAGDANHQQVTPAHVMAALLADPEGVVYPLLHKLGVAPRSIAARLQGSLDRLPKVYGGSQPYLSQEVSDLLDAAAAEAETLGDAYVSTEHVLLAFLDSRDEAGRALTEAGVDRARVLNALKEIRGSQRVTDQNPEETYQALERFGRDLTDAARRGKLDPVIGRDDEIRRVIQVLSRRTKN
ncbi:MAG TPA: Clp protease N-terminal domain-containing protein, partial [Actinomycetota bacterium]|nr:Clp protease N-terminal domain-containing protein [Actinomycetota bacterium]